MPYLAIIYENLILVHNLWNIVEALDKKSQRLRSQNWQKIEMSVTW